MLEEASKIINSVNNAFQQSFTKRLCQYLHDCIREEVKSSTFRNLASDRDNKWAFLETDAGMLITPEKLEYGKGYSLKEVSAPYGYVLSNESVKFDVTEDNSTEDSGITVVEVKLGNLAQKGIIKISKSKIKRP